MGEETFVRVAYCIMRIIYFFTSQVLLILTLPSRLEWATLVENGHYVTDCMHWNSNHTHIENLLVVKYSFNMGHNQNPKIH